MRILLLKPSWPYPVSKGESTYNRIFPPLSLMNCASLLESERHEVKILDAHADRLSLAKVLNRINEFDKIFITSSSLDRWQCPNIDIKPFLDIVKAIKNVNSSVYIMGYHGTVEPERILKITGAVAVIRGEPELTVKEICQNKNLIEIKGITFIQDNFLVSNKDREPLDIESLPIPAYHLIPVERYFYEILGDKFALFEMSRGCPYSCLFCSKIMYGDGFRQKKPEQINEELAVAIGKYGIKSGYFIDLEFSANGKSIDEVCNFLIKSRFNFRWCCQMRIDKVNEDMLQQMKKAGCRLLHFGIETGSDRTKEILDKNISLQEVRKKMSLVRKMGFETLLFFILGFPNESKEDMIKTMKYARELKPTYVTFHMLFPYQGSPLWEKEKEGALLQISDSSKLRRVILNFFLKFYLRPWYILERIIHSNPRLLLLQLKLFFRYLLKI